MSNLAVITAGHDLALLMESAALVKITLKTFDGRWTDFVDIKLRRLISFLSTVTEEYCMWVDGHDSLILQPEDVILSRLFAYGNSHLFAYGNPVVIAAESNCWPDANREGDYAKFCAPFTLGNLPRFINAGGFIGNRHQLLTALHTVLACAKDGDDQRAWTTAYILGMIPQVQIDHARRIFSCARDGADAVEADTCVLHWNGRATGREEFWRIHCESQK